MLEKKTVKSTEAAPKKRAEAAPSNKKPSPTKAATGNAASKPAASRRRQSDMHERVQRRAYELWESEGRPAGREHDHWGQAEREVANACFQHVGVSR